MKRRTIFLAMIIGLHAISLLLQGCSSRKKVIESREAMSQTVTESKGVDEKVITETRGFDEELKGQIPANIFDKDTVTVVFESKGGSLKLEKKGTDIYFNGLAKPTTITNTNKETHTQADSTAITNTEKQQAASDTRTSWSLPWWVWLLAVVLAAFGIYKLLKPFLK